MENMETSKKILDRDFWVGAGLVIIGIILLTQIEVAERIHGIYPGFVFGLITLMGLLLFISSVRKKEFIHIKNSFITLLEAVYFLIILRSEEHTSELQSRGHLVCRLLLEKKNR